MEVVNLNKYEENLDRFNLVISELSKLLLATENTAYCSELKKSDIDAYCKN